MSVLILLGATLSGCAVGALITRMYYVHVMREAAAEMRDNAEAALSLLKPTQAD